MDATTGRVEDTTNDHSQEWSGDIDISQLCRVCACTNEYLIPIFQGEGLEHELENKIKKHLPLSVSESDSLPLHLCYQCASTLIAWNDLVITCIESEEKFKQLVKLPEELDNIQSGKSCNKENEAESQPSNNAELFATVVKPGDTIIFQPADAICDNPMGDTSSMLPIINSVSSIETGSINEVPSNTRCDGLEEASNDSKTNKSYDFMEVDFDKPTSGAVDQNATMNTSQLSNHTKGHIYKFANHIRRKPGIKNNFKQQKNIANKLLEEVAASQAGFKLQPSVGYSVPLYICTTCGQGNLLFKNLDDHSKTHLQCSETYFCQLCQQQFVEKIELDMHLEIHLDNNDLVCQFCNKKFSIIEDLEKHEDTHLKEEFKCVECSEIFVSKESVLSHFKTIHSTGYYCQICQTMIKNEVSLDEHFMTHIVVNAITRIMKHFICEICGVKYDSNVSLQRHRLFVHNDRMPYICDICGFTAYHEEPLREHLDLKHNAVTDKSLNQSNKRPQNSEMECSKRRKPDLGIDSVEETQELYNCEFCNINFDNKLRYSYHVSSKHNVNVICKENKRTKINQVVTDLFPFKCLFCNASFKLEFELEDHKDKKHNYITYQCHFCFIDFRTDLTLQKHLRKVHYDEYLEDDSD